MPQIPTILEIELVLKYFKKIKKNKKKEMVVSQSYIIKNLNHIIKWQIKESLDQSPKEV